MKSNLDIILYLCGWTSKIYFLVKTFLSSGGKIQVALVDAGDLVKIESGIVVGQQGRWGLLNGSCA